MDEEGKSCIPSKALYVIVNVESGKHVSNGLNHPMYIDYCGESTIGVNFCENGVNVMYANTKFISIYTPKLMSIVGSYISGNLRSGITVENHKDYYDVFDTIVADITTKEKVNELCDYIDSLKSTKITEQHHLFINRQEIRLLLNEIYRDNNYRVKLAAIIAISQQAAILGIDNRVTLITHIMYILVAPEFAILHLMSIVGQSKGYSDYIENLKHESVYAKQLQTIFRDDLSVVYELNVLMNRTYSEVNWENEVENRTNTKAVNISSEYVYKCARQIFQDGVNEGRVPKKTKWDDYWKSRWASMPSGSVVSQYEDDLALKKNLPLEARVKAAWFAALTDQNYSKWHSRVPLIYASTSTKYEWGKVRALYGCDVTSFLHSDYGMPDCEDMLPSYFPVGRKANEKYINNVMDKFKDTVPVCFDYDDFNSQHSTSSMRTVIKAWIDTYSGYLDDDQVLSATWTMKSLDTATVRFNELKKTYPINGTLMSGWRLTSFMNTVLNRVYLMKAGLEQHMVYALHNGDDMFGGAVNMHEALTLIDNALEEGIRAQVSKTNLGTIGEFLRVDTRAKSRCNSQYLSRSVSTLVHGRIEASTPNDLREIISANIVRCDEVKSRSGDPKIVNITLRLLQDFMSRLFEVSNEVIDQMIKLHPIQGGMSESAEIGLYRVKRILSSSDIEEVNNRFYQIQPGLNDYIDLVMNQYQITKRLIDRNDIFYHAGLSLQRNKVSYEIVVDNSQHLDIYRGLYKAWATPGYVAPIAKIRSLGLAPARELRNLRSQPAHLIRNARDPIKLMSVIF